MSNDRNQLPRSDEGEPGPDEPTTDHEQDDWSFGDTVDLDEVQTAELSRLRARMGFRLINDRYEILRTLGEGGMGVVYQVYDREMDSREVALKLVRHSGLSDLARAQQRLRQEARQMARLRNHPHVVTVLDVGTDAGATYLTMEYVAGTDLRGWCVEQVRPARKLLQAYLGAARGLLAAHEIGIVHRDFKPDNVLIDTSGTAKVADFGIAAVRDTSTEPVDGREEGRTEVRGTVPYMSPEQMAGERVDARTDQFSFCMALWEALTGRLPYTWRDAQSQLAALAGAPAGVDRAPRWLRGALLRGMSAERSARYRDMRELIAIIERGLARPKRIKRALWGALGALSIGALAAVRTWNPPEPTCERFVASVSNHWGDAQRSELAKRRHIAPESVDWTMAKLDEATAKWAQAAEDSCEGKQAPPPDDPGRRCLEAWLSSFDRAIDLLVTRGDESTLRRAPDLLARIEAPGGDFCAVEERPFDPELAELVEGARGAAVLGARERAEQLSLAALDRARSIAGGQRYTEGLAHAHAARGQVLSMQNDFDEATTQYALAEKHAAGTNELRVLARIRILWARNLTFASARAGAAEAHLGRAEPLFGPAPLPPDSLLRGEIIEVQALADEAQGELDEAAKGYTEAAKFFTGIGNPILAARARGNRGVLNHGRGELRAAEADYRAAIESYLAAKVPPTYPRLLDARYNLGLVLLDRYYESQNERVAEDALDVLQRVIAHAPAKLRLTAYGYAVELAADAQQIERLRGLIEPALATYDVETELGEAIQDRVRLQLGRALLEGLGDPRGEALYRELLEHAERLELHTYWILMPSWIEHLEHDGRCAEALAVTKGLRNTGDYEELQTWKNERPGEACR